jgi:hypothetical protein
MTSLILEFLPFAYLAFDWMRNDARRAVDRGRMSKRLAHQLFSSLVQLAPSVASADRFVARRRRL